MKYIDFIIKKSLIKDSKTKMFSDMKKYNLILKKVALMLYQYKIHSVKEICKMCKMKRSTFYYYLKKLKFSEDNLLDEIPPKSFNSKLEEKHILYIKSLLDDHNSRFTAKK